MLARTYTANEIVHVVVKNRWIVLVPLAIGIAAAPILARFAPARFKSEALLLVVPQQVPQEYVQPTVTESVADRLPSITATILSRGKLEQIILDMDLYTKERSREVMEDVVDMMRTRDIKTAAIGRQVDSFRVSYVNTNPETARKVTERLASLYIDQNERDRATQAEQTSQFLAKELEQAKQRLLETESKLEAYKRSHPGQLPAQLPANMQAVQNATMVLTSLSQNINSAQQRRLLVERQLADAQAMPMYDSPAPAGTEALTSALSTAQQLEVAQTRLDSLLTKYTEINPEVTKQKRLIAELTAQLENETPLSGRSAGAKRTTPAEVAQQQRIQNLKNELAVIDKQLSDYQADENRLRKTIGEYQAKVDVVPTRESELVELTRDYATQNAQYTTLLAKRADAGIAANLERNRIGEQFKLLDPASRPEKPYNGVQRVAVVVSGAMAGLLLGLLTVGLREYCDPSFRDKDEVVRALSLPVLASIPMMTSLREREAARRRQWAIDIGGSIVVVASVTILVFWRLYT